MVFEDFNLLLSSRGFVRDIQIEETQILNLGFYLVTGFGSMHIPIAGSFG